VYIIYRKPLWSAVNQILQLMEIILKQVTIYIYGKVVVVVVVVVVVLELNTIC